MITTVTGTIASAPWTSASINRSEKIEATAAATMPRGAIHIRNRRSGQVILVPKVER